VQEERCSINRELTKQRRERASLAGKRGQSIVTIIFVLNVERGGGEKKAYRDRPHKVDEQSLVSLL